MKYNIAIRLPQDIHNKAIEFSNIVAQNGGIFVLGTQNNFPHITIAHFECDDENIEEIISDVKKITDMLQIFDIKSNKYRASNGWIDVSFQLQKDLTMLYGNIVNILRKYNCKITSNDWRQKNAPHITFSKMSKNDIFDINMLPKYNFSFTVNRIELFERGEHGTNKRLLKEFKLQ